MTPSGSRVSQASRWTPPETTTPRSNERESVPKSVTVSPSPISAPDTAAPSASSQISSPAARSMRRTRCVAGAAGCGSEMARRVSVDPNTLRWAAVVAGSSQLRAPDATSIPNTTKGGAGAGSSFAVDATSWLEPTNTGSPMFVRLQSSSPLFRSIAATPPPGATVVDSSKMAATGEIAIAPEPRRSTSISHNRTRRSISTPTMRVPDATTSVWSSAASESGRRSSSCHKI